MTAGQIFLSAATIAAIAFTYFFAPLTPPSGKISDSEKKDTVAVTFDAAAFEMQEISNLSESASSKFQQLTKAAEAETSLENKVALLNEAAELLEENELYFAAALRRREAADAAGEEAGADTLWLQAGRSFYQQVFPSDSVSLNNYLNAQAVTSYEKALEINPENTDAKIGLAVTYLETSTENVMKGVLLLRDITDNDPGNITANLLLGRYGIVSGQFDKAVQRLEKVLSVDSTNAEAYLYLAEAYEGMGKKDQAIRMLEKCRELVKTPGFSDVITQYIEKLKNS